MENSLTEENIKIFNDNTRENIIKQYFDEISEITSESKINYRSKIQNLFNLKSDTEEKENLTKSSFFMPKITKKKDIINDKYLF